MPIVVGLLWVGMNFTVAQMNAATDTFGLSRGINAHFNEILFLSNQGLVELNIITNGRVIKWDANLYYTSFHYLGQMKC